MPSHRTPRGSEDALRRALEESERLFTALFTTALDAVLIADDERRYVDANPAACELLARTREQIIGLSVEDIGSAPPGDVVQAWQRFLTDGEQRGEFEIVRPDGSRRCVEFAARANFVPGRHLSILRDITLRRQAEEALRTEAQRKDDFLAVLAHELRHPLAPLGNALRLARLDEHRDYALELATRQVGRLSRLVDDLLDVSSVGQGKLELRRETLDLRRLVEHAVEALRHTIDERGHRLSVSLPREPVLVEADPTRLEQVVVNLLGNAAKYTDQGGHIELTVERLDDEVEIRVRDTGIGIAPDMLPRIFTLFAQSDRARAHVQGGLGIGLTLVQRLVELHGGRVEAHSAGVGRGSEFRVRLPTRSGTATRDASAGPQAPVAGRPLRVLLVDDSADLTESLRMLLEASGHRVRDAHDGQSGLEAARREPPDVALVDLALPGMNGFELARRIREEPGLQRTVLIALSGWGRDEDRERAREAGFDHHLVKPIDIDAIDDLLARLTPAAG